MELVPVIDLMGGQVVRGIAGQRDSYQPNRSLLVDGSAPVQTAVALREAFHVSRIYVADLDALEGRGDNEAQTRSLVDAGIDLAVDAGINTAAKAARMFEQGVRQVILPLEGLVTLDVVGEVVNAFGPDRIVFSLDLKNGQLLNERFRDESPCEVAKRVIELGIRTMIVLDLAGVGRDAGVPTLALCETIKKEAPFVTLWSGGGVRSIDDLTTLNNSGVDGALVASALHDGKLTPQQWHEFCESTCD